MGNTSSNVTSGVKSQVDSGSRDVYRLADLGGGGQMVALAVEARKSGCFVKLDERIRDELPKFLYNDGQGELMPIADVINMRHKERTGQNMNTQTTSKDPIEAIKKRSRTSRVSVVSETPILKEVCWRLDQRGSVGETVVHVCFLCGSSDHMILAKRIIMHYPKIINDIYLSDEYYGENVLHMAIVNEDPQMVRFLLRHGANVHQRCCGNFFTPDDQKPTRTDSRNHEWVKLSSKTSYNGHMYWGEYPLAFAACLKQEECFRLLIANKADPNAQDTNGNTILHIMVLHEDTDMFDLAFMVGAKIHILNRQNLTPLTLAAKLAKKEMFDHVLEKEREVYWTYGGVTCAAYPLEFVDTIQPVTGQINKNSALALVVYGKSSDHLNLLDGFMEKLLRQKWETYGRKMLFRNGLQFLIYFLIVATAFYLRPTPIEESRHENVCYMWKHENQWDTVRFICESLSVFGAFIYLLLMLIDIRSIGSRLYFISLSGFPAKAIFMVSCVLVLLTVVWRILCITVAEDITGLIAVLLTSLKFLYFCRGFKTVGPFVLTIYKIIVGDLIRFILIYFIFIMGFSQSFFIIFLDCGGDKQENISIIPSNISLCWTPAEEPQRNILGNFFESFNRMFILSLNEFGVFYENLEECRMAGLGKLFFMVFIILVSVLLINMLIAMMNNTYTEVTATKNEWLRQWAAIILMLEQGLNKKSRLLYQAKYASPMRDRTKLALVVRWRLTEEQKTEMRQERQQRYHDWYTERKQSRMEAKSSKPSVECCASAKISVGGVLAVLSGRNERTHE